MYLYVVDTSLIKKKSNIVSDLKQLIKRYNIDGYFVFLSALHDIKKDIKNHLKDVNSIIVIGDSHSFNKIVDIIFNIDRNNNFVFGLIPCVEDFLSKILGLSSDLEKNTLYISQRLYKKVDVCKVNNKYFMDHLLLSFPFNFNLAIDFSYSINFNNNCEIIIGNLFFDPKLNYLTKFNDGFVDVYLYNKKNNIVLGGEELIGKFRAKNINITSKFGVKFKLNNLIYKSNIINIENIEQGIKIITNKSSILNC